jgi:hypothetical protein
VCKISGKTVLAWITYSPRNEIAYTRTVASLSSGPNGSVLGTDAPCDFTDFETCAIYNVAPYCADNPPDWAPTQAFYSIDPPAPWGFDAIALCASLNGHQPWICTAGPLTGGYKLTTWALRGSCTYHP